MKVNVRTSHTVGYRVRISVSSSEDGKGPLIFRADEWPLIRAEIDAQVAVLKQLEDPPGLPRVSTTIEASEP